MYACGSCLEFAEVCVSKLMEFTSCTHYQNCTQTYDYLLESISCETMDIVFNAYCCNSTAPEYCQRFKSEYNERCACD